ncbi:MAG TPA: asparaginase [Blastocatellia bacterium]|nr:asparaginase [Blastocatellia bacterium]
MSNMLPVLVEVSRGAIVESRHRGAIVLADPGGKVLASIGDADLISSTRSAIKPIQALPIITSGAAERFGLTGRELAAACASHEGELIHTETVAGMLARVGLDETALRCGAHAPFSADRAVELERDGLAFNQLHNNCSGKHAGMLMTAAHRGLSLDDYVSVEHPVQREIVKTFARLGDLDENLPTAIDGCSAPTFGVPLRSLAVAFARLVNCAGERQAPAALDGDLAGAANRAVRAMIEYPEMIGGTKGRFDTELLRASHGKLVCKVGAEAVYAVGVLPCEKFPRGLGLAFKMEDGSYRGLGPAVVEALVQLGVLDEAESARLASFHHPILENRRGLGVGSVRAVFELRFNERQ